MNGEMGSNWKTRFLCEEGNVKIALLSFLKVCFARILQLMVLVFLIVSFEIRVYGRG